MPHQRMFASGVQAQQPGGIGAILRWFGWLVVVLAGAATLISLRYVDGINWPSDGLGLLYLLLSRIGHFALLVGLLCAMLVLPVLLVGRLGRASRIWSMVCGGLLLTLLLADTFVYQQYRFHINGAVLDLLFNGGGQVISFSWQMQLAIAGITLLLGLVAYGLTRVVDLFYRRPGYGRRMTIAIVVSLLVANGLNAWAVALDYRPITRLAGQLPLYYPLTANRLMMRLGLVDAEALQQRRVKVDDEASELRYPLNPLVCNKPERPLNLVLVLIDTLRADMLTPAIMPNLSRLADNGWRFDHHLSSSNGTRAGVFGLFYGLPPSYWHASLANNQAPALITTLQQQDYPLGIFASSPLTAPEFNKTVFASVPDLRLKTVGDSPAQRDLAITREWSAWLQQQNQPFFSFLFYDAAHGYSMPDDYPKPFLPQWDAVNQLQLGPDFDKTPYFNRYKNSVHFIDSQLAVIERQLKAQGRWEDTVLIITSDHGEEFNDNGKNYWGHNGNFTETQTRVPLVIHWPGKGKGLHAGITSHYDITATLMPELLGCQNSTQDYSIGENLFTFPNHDGVIMGSYTETALHQDSKITLIDKLGQLSVRDGRYDELNRDQLPRDKVVELLDMQRRYRVH